MKLTTELTIDQIAELIYLEARKQNIAMTEDSDDLEQIFTSAAEHIAYEGSLKDISEAVERIKEYVSETKRNYPNFFLNGES